MKLLLPILLIIIFQVSWASSDVDSVDLIFPTSYQRKAGTAQSLKSSTQILLGDLIGAADIGPKIKKSIAPYEKDLANDSDPKSYYKKAELDKLVNELIDEANRTIVKDDINDKKAIEVNKFFGNKLISQIADRILKVEGVEDASRRKLWVDKLLKPFNECIGKSTNALYSADHCMTALTSSIVPSAGVGIVYELSRENLSKSMENNQQLEFNSNQVNLYKQCLSKVKTDASSVKNCSLSAMKLGMFKISEPRLQTTIDETANSKSSGKVIKDQVWPGYSKCINAVGDKESSVSYTNQFFSCIDKLTIETGILLVKNKIENTDAVKSTFNKAEIEKITNEKSNSFKKCAESLVSRNIRKDGMINIDTCKNEIENDMTYKVITKTFSDTSKSMLKGQNAFIKTTNEVGQQALDACWPNASTIIEKNNCIRKSVIIFSKNIAAYKLDSAIPETTTNKVNIKKYALDTFDTCLSKELPQNIIEANNTTLKISACSDKLTKNIALTVAKSEVRTAATGSLTEQQLDKFIQTAVEDKFLKCIGNNPTDSLLDSCSNTLRTLAASSILDANLESNLPDKKNGKLSFSAVRSEIKNKAMANYKTCLSNPNTKETCSDELKKEADREIVLAVEKSEIQEQLNTNSLPSILKPIEETFVKCTKTESLGEKLSTELESCNVNFSINFARELGKLVVINSLTKALGSEDMQKNQKSIDTIIDKYNSCLDLLSTTKMSDGLTTKIGTCTSNLEKNALNLVKNNLNEWMTSPGQDQSTAIVKQEFAAIIPCLSVLLPSSPYSPELEKNVISILKPVAQILAQYIEYSPSNAKQNLDDVFAKLTKEMNSDGLTEKSKSELIDLLYDNGALDQVLKALVRSKARDSFNTLAESDLPKSIRDQLLTKDNFDALFSSEEGKKVKVFVKDNILKPMVANSKESSQSFDEAYNEINNQVVKMLISSPRFGDIIVKSGIQSQINQLGGFTKFLAKSFYGKDSLVWDKVRDSEYGRKAEDYIREHIIKPKFEGKTLSQEEEKLQTAIAEKLVKEAVKKYSKEK
jgi:hypothetical protein